VVEHGTVEQIFNDPRHPYTEGLLRAIPRLGQNTRRLTVIPGTVPPPTAWPDGCRFHTRCPYAWEKTTRDQPDLFPVAGDPTRLSRCWLEQYPEHRVAKETLEARP
jgi:oligopeptide/dipeptide ABC transporter ATP-binding protein